MSSHQFDKCRKRASKIEKKETALFAQLSCLPFRIACENCETDQPPLQSNSEWPISASTAQNRNISQNIEWQQYLSQNREKKFMFVYIHLTSDLLIGQRETTVNTSKRSLRKVEKFTNFFI